MKRAAESNTIGQSDTRSSGRVVVVHCFTEASRSYIFVTVCDGYYLCLLLIKQFINQRDCLLFTLKTFFS